VDIDRPFPCLDGHTYSGCLGANCPVERCWNGRRLRPLNGAVRADTFDRPLRVLRYTASDCANCVHAVDLHVEGEMRSAGGRRMRRSTLCELGLWAGPASLYNLLNHRVPRRYVGRCESFQARTRQQMRPELLRQREADQARSRARRDRRREAREKERGSGQAA